MPALTDRGDTTTLPQSAVARLLAHWRAKMRMQHDPAAPVDGDVSDADPPRPPPLTPLTRRRRSLPAAAPAEGAGGTGVKAPFSIGEVVLARDGGHQAGRRAHRGRIVDVRGRAAVEASNGAQQAAAAAAAAA
eukprot:COSAG02_NODE_28815_length_582_cov_0.434783_1_plen_132_part_01